MGASVSDRTGRLSIPSTRYSSARIPVFHQNQVLGSILVWREVSDRKTGIRRPKIMERFTKRQVSVLVAKWLDVSVASSFTWLVFYVVSTADTDASKAP